MTTTEQIQHEIATISNEDMREKILHFIRFLKWEQDYVDDPRLSEEEKQDGLSYEWRQELLTERNHVRQTGELYSFDEVFGTSTS